MVEYWNDVNNEIMGKSKSGTMKRIKGDG